MKTRRGIVALGWWALSSMDKSSILAGGGWRNRRGGGGCGKRREAFVAAGGVLPMATSTAKNRCLRADRRALQVHGRCDYVGVLQARAGVEEDYAIAGLEETGGEQAIVGSRGCGAF